MATLAEVQAEIEARQRSSSPLAMLQAEMARRAGAEPPPVAGPSVGERAKDATAAFLSGAARSAASLADLPSKFLGGGVRAMATGSERIGLLGPELAEATRRSTKYNPLTQGNVMEEGLRAVTGGASDYQPETLVGEYARTVGEFAPGMIGGGGVGGALRYVVAPALVSETAGQMTKDTAAEPFARAAGAVLTPFAPNIASRVVSPFGRVNPERLKMASVLDDFGVPITAGQRTGSEGLRRMEASSSGGQRVASQQQEAFTKAALKTIGETADAATPEVLEAAARRIGGVFDDVGRSVSAVPDADDLTQFSGALETYRALTPSSDVAPIFREVNKRLVDAFRSGAPIPGREVLAWRSNLSKLTRSGDIATREAAVSALDALDDVVTKSLTAAGMADDVARLDEARGQWRNLLAIEVAASRAGEGAAVGILSPSQLRNAVVQQGRRSYVQNKRGDLGSLSRSAEAVMKPLPTVEAGGMRSFRGMSDIVGAGVGGGAAASYGVDPFLGALLGATIPRATREAVSSAPIQRYLQNQVLSGASGTNPLRTVPGLLGSAE